MRTNGKHEKLSETFDTKTPVVRAHAFVALEMDKTFRKMRNSRDVNDLRFVEIIWNGWDDRGIYLVRSVTVWRRRIAWNRRRPGKAEMFRAGMVNEKF